MSICKKRLCREVVKIMEDMKNDKLSGISIDNHEDIMLWEATIFGPEDTPYQGGKFKLQIKFTTEYPVKPPSVKFISKMFHPNIYRDGKVCIDILQGEWSPALNVRTILLSLRSMLMDPNPRSPANRDAAKLFTDNFEEFSRRVGMTIT